MHEWKRLAAAAVAMTGLLAGAAARAVETGDVTLEEGFVEPQSGIRVERIVARPGSDIQEVHLAVPRASVSDGAVDEVVVTAERPRRMTLPQLKPHQFVADYEHDYYGLVVFLGKHENVPVRFYLDARQQAPGTVVP